MRILLSMKHENIIDIKDFLCENSISSLKDIYIIQVIIIDHHQFGLSSANIKCKISSLHLVRGRLSSKIDF